MSTTTNTPRLWTRNFTILTLGSIISRLGSALSGFALGLLILDYSGSTFLYALFLFAYSAPRVIMPLLAGPYLDRFSRRKAIFTLDFISAGIYTIFAVIMAAGWFNYPILIIGCLILGSIDSVYTVAYESFYPLLISKGNYTKAYSISSTLETMVMLMVPVSALLYNVVGIVPLFIINAVSFFVAALFETRIKVTETHTTAEKVSYTLHKYADDFKDGLNYLKKERGLRTITLYFAVSSFAGAAFETIVLPYFKGHFPNGEYTYIMVFGFMMFGRMLGGAIHYKFAFPVAKKFSIAIFVYCMICLLDGSFLYCPVPVMMAACFVSGILGVTSYNIRISGTQSYVEDKRKGRFNGIFQMLTMVGMLAGQLLSGALAEFISERIVLTSFMVINLIAVFLIMYRNREHVKPIYNRQA